MELKIWMIVAISHSGSSIMLTITLIFNILTGKGTFHGMGIMSVIQPGKIKSDKLVTRIQKRKITSEVIKNKGIKIQSFLGSSSKGLSNIKLKPMRQLIPS